MSHIEQISHELTWRIRREVLYPGQPLDKIMLPDDKNGMHLGLFDDHKLISVLSFFKNDQSIHLRKFATLEPYQRRGYGTELLNYLLEISEVENYKRIWCNARKNASGFYSKFGFKETENSFQKDGHDFVIMEKILKTK
ncbi:MAG: GNAT family N-acetyltransferase [Bacteroidetes bacterium]|jgi:GNAT superfamily N-acetyltransferase|uniref:GNAT family N-acetyltransferase n=1 Tax=Daejeonella sp. TaxID=2805397 RepID=UPI0040491D22|nr:GNAT family N-acetyltransferase [Bacteroidota bacterium]